MKSVKKTLLGLVIVALLALGKVLPCVIAVATIALVGSVFFLPSASFPLFVVLVASVVALLAIEMWRNVRFGEHQGSGALLRLWRSS